MNIYFRLLTKTQRDKNSYKQLLTVSLSLVPILNPINSAALKTGKGQIKVIKRRDVMISLFSLLRP